MKTKARDMKRWPLFVLVCGLISTSPSGRATVHVTPTGETSSGFAVETLLQSVEEDIDEFRNRRDTSELRGQPISQEQTKSHISKGRSATYATAEYRVVRGGKIETHTIFGRSGPDQVPWQEGIYDLDSPRIMARADHGEFASRIRASPGMEKAHVDAELKIARTTEYLIAKGKLPPGGELRMWVSQPPCASCSEVLKTLDADIIKGRRLTVYHLPLNEFKKPEAPSARFHQKRTMLLNGLKNPRVPGSRSGIPALPGCI